MKCPYCKGLLQLKNEEYYCEYGNCYFSKNISNYFIEAAKSDKVNNMEFTKNESKQLGRFFCVHCGDKMRKTEELCEVCTSCGFIMNKSVYYQIIELSVHK